MAWRNRALGAGGRRPEPTLVALMSSVAWLVYGIRVADDKIEPVFLNGWGGLFQMVYLGVFLWLCTSEERNRFRIRAAYACLYICLLFFIDYRNTEVLNNFCTFTGCVPGLAPLLSLAFLV